MSAPKLNTAINVAEIFNQVYGYTPAKVAGLPTGTNMLPDAQIQPITQKTENIYGEPLYSQSDLMGRQVFCPVTIEFNGVDYEFPFCVIGITRSKTVVMTEMTELNGTVKEIISNKDFDIDIKGFLIGDYDQFPDDKLQMLNNVFEYNQTVRLKSAFSDIFLHANDNVLILKMDVPPKPKVIGVRDFSLTMVSDGIFTLYVS